MISKWKRDQILADGIVALKHAGDIIEPGTTIQWMTVRGEPKIGIVLDVDLRRAPARVDILVDDGRRWELLRYEEGTSKDTIFLAGIKEGEKGGKELQELKDFLLGLKVKRGNKDLKARLDSMVIAAENRKIRDVDIAIDGMVGVNCILVKVRGNRPSQYLDDLEMVKVDFSTPSTKRVVAAIYHGDGSIEPRILRLDAHRLIKVIE